jgi:membrane associated rhomboid family serine protease
MMMTMIRTTCRKWPSCVGLAILMVVLHIMTELDMVELKHMTIRPVKVFKRREFYRIVTNALFHEKGLSHLGLNLMTLYGFGRGLEKKLGSRAFLFMTVWSILVTSGLYLIGATIISQTSEHPKSWYKHGTKGFSGVLFHYVTIRCHAGSGTMGLGFLDDIKVPTRYYPWATMALWHLLEPDNGKGTFMHACGIVLGILHMEGYLGFILPDIPKKKDNNENDEPKEAIETPKKEVSTVDPTSVRDARLKRFQ